MRTLARKDDLASACPLSLRVEEGGRGFQLTLGFDSDPILYMYCSLISPRYKYDVDLFVFLAVQNSSIGDLVTH